MKILIYLASTSRRSVPRVGGFLYNEEHQKYLYGGRPLDVEEANEAAQACLDKPLRNLGHTVTFRVISDEAALPAPVKAVQAPAETPQEAPAETPEAEEEASEAPPAPKFSIVGEDILKDGEKVAGFDAENNLRMTRGHGHLREEVETFLNSKD